MIGNFAFLEIGLLVFNVLLVIGLFIGVPLLIVRYVPRSRSSPRDEIEALEERIARLEAELRR